MRSFADLYALPVALRLPQMAQQFRASDTALSPVQGAKKAPLSQVSRSEGEESLFCAVESLRLYP